jgi:hypothetical protein
MANNREPKEFAVDHDVMSPIDHFKLLVTQLDAFKNDYVNREIRAGALAQKYVRGVPKTKASGLLMQYNNYCDEVNAFADHIYKIRVIMSEVWPKLDADQQAEMAAYKGDLITQQDKEDQPNE